jgi:hypothetical protein
MVTDVRDFIAVPTLPTTRPFILSDPTNASTKISSSFWNSYGLSIAILRQVEKPRTGGRQWHD